LIVSFRHKGLQRLYEMDSAAGVRADQLARLRRILSILDCIESASEARLPGLRLHSLKGELAGYWSLSVSGNWRVVFRMEGSDVAQVDLQDYH